jgi:hypothetical protein
MIPFVQASAALVESLFDDPFYWAITEGLGDDLAARKHALSLYFHYSLEEADRTGRCIVAPDPRLGAAAWLLPRSRDVDAAESSAKSRYLSSALGSREWRTTTESYVIWDRLQTELFPVTPGICQSSASCRPPKAGA